MSIEIVLAISASLLIIPVLITRWLWFWVFSLLLGLPMIGVWAVYFYQTSQPEYSGSPQGFFGILIMVLVSGSLALGMFLRYIRWVIGIKVHEIKAAKALGSVAAAKQERYVALSALVLMPGLIYGCTNQKGKGGIMAKSGSGSKGGGRGPSSHPGPGGNWPSTSGNPSGGGRGNGPSKGK